ncbi:MAG: TraR/DksA family transcriptional regulator [Candidatus Paceibacterota bacterium]
MNEEKINILEQRLLKEKSDLEEELSSVGERDLQNPDDWMAAAPEMDTSRADESERADADEEYGENSAILHNLEVRYSNVKNALARIEEGTYGVCSVCGEEIEEERLEANPAADTCLAHKNIET